MGGQRRGADHPLVAGIGQQVQQRGPGYPRGVQPLGDVDRLDDGARLAELLHHHFDVALELERIALEDDFFVSRNLYPNVDFYSGIIYQAMRFPVAMFPVLFAIPRTVGWLSQWIELLEDSSQKIARPRQVYLGEEIRDYKAPIYR